jgi:acetolactate synthase-1/2/3 large subunit
MYLNDALARSSLTSTVCLHEQSVAIAAEYYGRLSSDPFGVALVTNGPGATNTLTAVAGAYIESVPLFVISGQVKTADYYETKSVRQTGVQEVNTLDMVRPITKRSIILLSADDIDMVITELISTMLSGRMGPVWLEVPLDLQGAPLPQIFQSSNSSQPDNHIFTTGFKCQSLHEIVDLPSEEFKRPLLLVGQGVRLSNSAEDLLEFIEDYDIPVITTFPAKDLIHYNHRLFIGHPGNVALRAANLAVQNCDIGSIILKRCD